MSSTSTSVSLYDKIGGAAAIDDLIDRFYERVVADPFLAPIFASTSMERLREMQKAFVSTALDGPETYAGRTLQDAHAGRGITAAHFAAFAGHLFDTLEEVGVDQVTVQAVIDRLAVNADDVVGGYGEEG